KKLIKIKKYTNKNILFYIFAIFKLKKIIKQIVVPNLRNQLIDFNKSNSNNNNQILLSDNLELFHAKIKN
ncbi:MAG: hypothetical protein ACKOXJ_06720, partial [Alphaproteobacteria bacterium]